MRNYLEQLQAAGDLLIVDREVDPRFELAEVTRAAQRSGDRALTGKGRVARRSP